MKIKIGVPIIIERVKIEGPEAIREVDLILDTGARFTSLSWDILKDVGYDSAVSKERVKIVTANGIIEVPLVRVKKISIMNFKTIIDYREEILEII